MSVFGCEFPTALRALGKAGEGVIVLGHCAGVGYGTNARGSWNT